VATAHICSGLQESVTEDPETAALFDWEFYEKWTNWILTIQRYIGGAKAVTLEYVFQDVEELLFESGFAKAFVPR
jgi:hypothetical protein